MSSFSLIIGVDEAGRGPWAGPVTAAAVVLDPTRPVEGLTDSKKLSEKARDRLAPLIRERALAWSVAEASVEEIDTLNIRQATFLAMQRAVADLFRTVSDKSGQNRTRPGTAAVILIDGNALPANLPAPARAIIKGDLTEPCISAASILAKTHRDAQMASLCISYPGYGFSGHKGYGTAAHAEALARLGPCAVHRQSFAPVRALLRHC
ncbi:ribonuclease HII [Hyphomonas sp. CACIAM 19H1]|uniref:ribonuclease HII n=1 Tax=Hyphomonas sp. CACIAM 19H1 TaxID=1873716 RepID=UPI000DED4D18|nr:ribonuclease HII [Hyphomonas sp. CACIAM 19H1]AXE65246.1 ribonuclease HII [Hyphomonas sp. CACIAM 19H1]